jgi:hypothetical protein
MKNIFTAILFLNVAFCIGQIKAEQKPFKNLDSIKKYDHSPAGEKSEGENLDFIQIFTSVDIQAQPFEGINNYRRYIASSFNLPEVSKKTTARVVAKFVVSNDGSIKFIQILEETPSNLGLGKETIRVLTNSRKWVPAKLNGKAVNQYYTLPISFEIPAAEKKGLPIEIVNKEVTPIVSEKLTETNISSPVKQAEPIGGIKKFYTDLSSKLQVPEVEIAGTYKTKVKFLVNQDGSLSDYQILEETPLSVGLGQIVVKYLQTSANWIPGEQNGRKIKTYFVLPVTTVIEPELEPEPELKKKD